MNTFKRIIPSELKIANREIDAFLGTLDSYVLGKETFYNLKLILNELVINGIKHGNRSDVTKKILFEVFFDKEKIRITVMDEGSGSKYDYKNMDPCSFATSGRGLFIVDQIAKELTVQGNKVVAVIDK